MENKQYTTNELQFTLTTYKAQPHNEGLRAYLFDVIRVLGREDAVMVDVRSPKEFTGEMTAPPEYPMGRLVFLTL